MSFDERPAGEIVAVDGDEVEDAEDNRVGGHPLGRRLADTQALLEPAERRLLAVECDHLAVE